MKRKGFFVTVISFAALSAGLLFAQGKSTVVMGYLTDVKCATAPNGVSADGADMANTPEKHTAACMRMPACEVSGYGVMLKGKNGKYALLKFDQKGTDLAKAYLKKTKRKDGLVLDVKGVIDGVVIKVESVKEASMDMDMGGMKM